ncbi:hypothetical protein RRG08_053847 [Elysia crispata]|uniref:Uncharacterized protein n=1 Tax=Elysia crispata TaxID=231223 RepID=A0AAE1A5X5_9GAST|nr:hypothetical protein RRG08_053847 [Elysia crispata]
MMALSSRHSTQHMSGSCTRTFFTFGILMLPFYPASKDKCLILRFLGLASWVEVDGTGVVTSTPMLLRLVLNKSFSGRDAFINDRFLPMISSSKSVFGIFLMKSPCASLWARLSLGFFARRRPGCNHAPIQKIMFLLLAMNGSANLMTTEAPWVRSPA